MHVCAKCMCRCLAAFSSPFPPCLCLDWLSLWPDRLRTCCILRCPTMRLAAPSDGKEVACSAPMSATEAGRQGASMCRLVRPSAQQRLGGRGVLAVSFVPSPSPPAFLKHRARMPALVALALQPAGAQDVGAAKRQCQRRIQPGAPLHHAGGLRATNLSASTQKQLHEQACVHACLRPSSWQLYGTQLRKQACLRACMCTRACVWWRCLRGTPPRTRRFAHSRVPHFPQELSVRLVGQMVEVPAPSGARSDGRADGEALLPALLFAGYPAGSMEELAAAGIFRCDGTLARRVRMCTVRMRAAMHACRHAGMRARVHAHRAHAGGHACTQAGAPIFMRAMHMRAAMHACRPMCACACAWDQSCMLALLRRSASPQRGSVVCPCALSW
eukprot:272231-Chlamydomonas_euryale.AAC.6